MAFQISVTHRFSLTPFCQQERGGPGERRGYWKRKNKNRKWSGRDEGWPQGCWRWGSLNGTCGQEGQGKSPVRFYPHDRSHHLNFSGPVRRRPPQPLPRQPSTCAEGDLKPHRVANASPPPLAPRADTVCVECNAARQALNKARETVSVVEGRKLRASK